MIENPFSHRERSRSQRCGWITVLVILCAWASGGFPQKAWGADRFPPHDGTVERDAFWTSYNQKTLTKLQEQEKQLTEELAKTTDGEAKGELERELAKTKQRLLKPEFFTFGTPADLPTDLQWQDGMQEPEIGSDQAVKGGVLRNYIMAFPATLRILGENANGSFRGYQYDDIELGLIGLHPETGKILPAVAQQWAVSADNRTVYFRLHPSATFSNGDPIEPEDFFQTFYMQLSEYPKNPFGNEWYATSYTNITKYDRHTLSITLADPKPMPEYFVNISPMNRRFFSEFGPDFEQRYQWRARPSTGAYMISAEDLELGRSVTLVRAKDWWAKDLKYYKNRYNVDRIVYRVVRLQEKIFELFRQGEIDVEELLMIVPNYWYEKMEIPEVHHGYIHKVKFYKLWPGTAAGLWLNTAVAPLNDREIRLGISYATNYQKVIDFDFRGDFQRLNSFAQGFALLGDPPITARSFDVQKAREHFAKAGYTKTGPDGVLRNDKEERLSVTILHRKNDTVDKVMQRLKEEALKCGLEYKLEGMDPTAFFQKALQKKHQIVAAGFNVDPPLPDHFQFFAAKDALMEDGKTPRPNTNNLCSYSNPTLDALVKAERDATNLDDFRKASWGADQIIHDEAVWIPGYDQNFYRCAYWRWVKWPETFNVAASTYAMTNHLHWIDEKLKEETLDAIRAGKKFPEVDQVFDQNLKTVTPSNQGEVAP